MGFVNVYVVFMEARCSMPFLVFFTTAKESSCERIPFEKKREEEEEIPFETSIFVDVETSFAVLRIVSSFVIRSVRTW